MSIESVLSQHCDDVELIVVDGASTDDSIKIIRRFDSQLAWWCSEKDSGQSNAFNKGFAHAKGKYLTWLNADDYMPAGSLKKICEELKAHPKCEWFTGNFYRFSDATNIITEVSWGPNFYPSWMQMKNSPLVIFGPSTFFSRAIYEKVGRIDETLHLTMDSDLWTRFIVTGIKQRRIRVFCWAFRMHRASKTEGADQNLLLEKRLSAEHWKTRKATGFDPSLAVRVILSLWRIIDGSYFYANYLKWKLVGKKTCVEEVL